MANGNHIRSFAKMFTNLTSGQRREFERALADLENSRELISLETSLDILKRSPDSALPIPQPIVTDSVRGGIIEWSALPDQKINFYEVDISSTSSFASFTTVSTFSTASVIYGLTSTKFLRVRGVRRDGTTTPYSSVQTMAPRLFDITTHSEEDFYIPIVGTDANTILGGTTSALDYTPINPNGNSMVWGFASIYGNPSVAMLGLDNITIDLIYRYIDTDGVTPVPNSETTVWSNSVGEFWSSTAIGPVTIPHPDLNQSLEIRLDVTDTIDDLKGGQYTEVFWAHLNSLELGIS